jgi:hypothetical protein
MKIIVYEEFVHVAATGNGWLYGFSELMHDVSKISSHNKRISNIEEYCDVLIVHGCDEYQVNDIISYKRKFPNSKICILCWEFNVYYIKLKEYVDLWFNLSIQNTYLSNLMNDIGIKIQCILLGSYPNLFYKLECIKKYDVSFFGTFAHGNRDEDKYLDSVINTNYVGIYGGFNNFPHVSYKDLNGIYNSTKINLNFHYKNQKIESKDDCYSRIELNGRVFDIATSGNFQICDHSYVNNIFGDSIPYVNEKDWLDAIEYYINHYDETERLVSKSHDIAIQYHSYKNRCEQILKFL